MANHGATEVHPLTGKTVTMGKTKRGLILGAAALGFTMLLTGCSQTVGDREGGAGKQADSYEDATHVTVYKNADNVPNVAFFCLDGFGWASTLSGGDSGKDKAAALIRFPEYDATCTGVEEPR